MCTRLLNPSLSRMPDTSALTAGTLMKSSRLMSAFDFPSPTASATSHSYGEKAECTSRWSVAKNAGWP